MFKEGNCHLTGDLVGYQVTLQDQKIKVTGVKYDIQYYLIFQDPSGRQFVRHTRLKWGLRHGCDMIYSLFARGGTKTPMRWRWLGCYKFP